jgi:hypothetical protein
MSLASRCLSLVMQVGKWFYRSFLEIDPARRIKFGKGFHFQIPSPKVQLFMSGTTEVVTMEMSMAEARQVLDSLKLAYELRDFQSVKAGDLTCMTDCRVDPKRPDRVTIKFRGSISANTFMSRASVGAALEEYEKKFLVAFGTAENSLMADQNRG